MKLFIFWFLCSCGFRFGIFWGRCIFLIVLRWLGLRLLYCVFCVGSCRLFWLWWNRWCGCWLWYVCWVVLGGCCCVVVDYCRWLVLVGCVGVWWLFRGGWSCVCWLGRYYWCWFFGRLGCVGLLYWCWLVWCWFG